METSFDYFDGTKLIIFWEGENPEDEIPEGWEIISRTEPDIYKGLVNPGSVVCRPPKIEQK